MSTSVRSCPHPTTKKNLISKALTLRHLGPIGNFFFFFFYPFAPLLPRHSDSAKAWRGSTAAAQLLACPSAPSPRGNMMLLYRNKEPGTRGGNASLSFSCQFERYKGSESGGAGGWCLLRDWTQTDCSFCLSETWRTAQFEYQRGKQRMREIDLGASWL